MAGAHDTNKVDQVNGKYDAKTDTYTNSDITLDYSANLRTVHVHYINQHGQDLNSNNTGTNAISGNVGEMLIPNEITDKVAMPAGYHLVKGDSNVVIQASGSSDVNYQVQGNAVKSATIEINYDHDGKLNKSKIIKVNLNGKHIGDSDVIVDPLQYQPINDTYHTIASDQPIFIQMKANDFNQNGDYLPRKHFTYDATTAAPLIIRYVDIDKDARSMNANEMNNGHKYC